MFLLLFRIIHTVLAARARRQARLQRLADNVIERLRQQIFEAEDDLSGRTLRGVGVVQAKREFFERLQVPLPAANPVTEQSATTTELNNIWKQITKLIEQSDLVEVKQVIIYGEILRMWEYVGSNATA